MAATTDDKQAKPDERSRKERHDDELKRYEEEAVERPKTRYFTVSVDLIASSDHEDVTSQQVERIVADQVLFPTWLSGDGSQFFVEGGKITGSSESDKVTEWDAGFGRSAFGQMIGAPAKSQERLSPPEAVVGEVAVARGGTIDPDAPGATPQTTVPESDMQDVGGQEKKGGSRPTRGT